MRAVAASDAPVPPFAIARSVPLQLLLLIVEAVASDPSPRLVRAPDALDAPVPPSAIARSVMPEIEPPDIDTLLDAWVAIDPRPNEVRAVEALSVTNVVPLPTIKFPSVGVSPDSACNSGSYA